MASVLAKVAVGVVTLPFTNTATRRDHGSRGTRSASGKNQKRNRVTTVSNRAAAATSRRYTLHAGGGASSVNLCAFS